MGPSIPQFAVQTLACAKCPRKHPGSNLGTLEQKWPNELQSCSVRGFVAFAILPISLHDLTFFATLAISELISVTMRLASHGLPIRDSSGCFRNREGVHDLRACIHAHSLIDGRVHHGSSKDQGSAVKMALSQKVLAAVIHDRTVDSRSCWTNLPNGNFQ